MEQHPQITPEMEILYQKVRMLTALYDLANTPKLKKDMIRFRQESDPDGKLGDLAYLLGSYYSE